MDNLLKSEVIEKIRNFLAEDNFHQIATVNPEFILEAQKNEEFRNILNNCDLNVADGFGLKFAFWRRGEKLKERIAGVDLMWEILKIASERGLRVFLVANKDGLSSWEEMKGAIHRTLPNLKIEGIDLEIDAGYKEIQNSHVVFCNFGHPYQEIFLNKQKNAIIRLAMGVGGSFDFVTGKVRRAPKIMRNLGLEWLFRLVQQPRRIKRIFNAVMVFPVKIIFNNKKL